MVDSWAEFKEQIQQLWTGLDKKTKIIIGISVVTTIIAIAILVSWASQPAYEVLFNNLSNKDAGAIVEKLKEQQVDYKLENQGSAILVPQQNVHQLRLELANDGLPAGGTTGFELFDQNQIGTTDFQQKVNYNRALSGKLSRTIKEFDNISYARVQITPAENSIYKDREQPAKASVFLELDGYQELAKNQVQSIANLVASSVNSLEPAQVTIVDTEGNLLSAQLEEKNQDGKSSYQQLEVQNKFESEIEKDLNEMLTKVLGINNFVVKVNADLNFDQRNVESKEYKPVVDDEGIVRSEQVKEESEEGSSSQPEGAPGTTSNVPQYQMDNTEQQSRESSESVVNYEINEKITKYVQAPGNLEQLSVSVMVNQDLDQQRQESISEAVSAAVGYNEERGDTIRVVGMEFDNSLEERINQSKTAETSLSQDFLLLLAAVIGALILIITFVLYRRRGSDEEEVEPGQEVDYVADEATEEYAATEELTDEEEEAQKLQRQLRNLAYDQPEEIAELIKSWLEE
ncbi:flagellar basal-body MS-ring/collar protein FliF [Halanaerobaculum tunisiense]